MYVGIYWNNHHHMLHAAESVSGAVLWANLHLLFWLSLIPFVTAWMDENYFVAAPVALYGCVLLMAAVAYFILARILIRDNGPNSQLAKAFGKDVKGRHLDRALCRGNHSVAVARVDCADDLHTGRNHVDHPRQENRKMMRTHTGGCHCGRVRFEVLARRQDRGGRMQLLHMQQTRLLCT